MDLNYTLSINNNKTKDLLRQIFNGESIELILNNLYFHSINYSDNKDSRMFNIKVEIKKFVENKSIPITIGNHFICEMIIRQIKYNHETNLHIFTIMQL